MSGVNRINTGSALPLSTNISVGRQTPDLSFGNRIQAGLGAAAGVVGSGLGIAGNAFVGGPAIVSAAVSSVNTLNNQQSSGAVSYAPGAVNATYAGFTSNTLGTTVTTPGVATTGGVPSGSSTSSVAGTSDMAGFDANLKTQQDENKQLLSMQAALQRENLVFSSLSNAMKTRHDTAKNSISNLR
ncbi:MAG: hypothetical protein FWD46_01835 [Cystobacterineae bacterium]|nr:hypothetical protein [Cystobacterineae bacterium]